MNQLALIWKNNTSSLSLATTPISLFFTEECLEPAEQSLILHLMFSPQSFPFKPLLHCCSNNVLAINDLVHPPCPWHLSSIWHRTLFPSQNSFLRVTCFACLSWMNAPASIYFLASPFFFTFKHWCSQDLLLKPFLSIYTNYQVILYALTDMLILM